MQHHTTTYRKTFTTFYHITKHLLCAYLLTTEQLTYPLILQSIWYYLEACAGKQQLWCVSWTLGHQPQWNLSTSKSYLLQWIGGTLFFCKSNTFRIHHTCISIKSLVATCKWPKKSKQKTKKMTELNIFFPLLVVFFLQSSYIHIKVLNLPRISINFEKNVSLVSSHCTHFHIFKLKSSDKKLVRLIWSKKNKKTHSTNLIYVNYTSCEIRYLIIKII